MKKALKILFIIFAVLSVLCLAVYFILQKRAADCDPVWEIKRHNALITAADRFLYMFPAAFAIAVGTGSAVLVLERKSSKVIVNESKSRDEITDHVDIKKIMEEKNISFFEAVWEYFLSVRAVERFKEAYISRLRWLNIDREITEANQILTDEQIETVKSELNKKIESIKNGEYDSVFESVFKEEVKREIEMSNNNAVGGMSPDEYLRLLFESSDGAMFFFDLSVCIENDMLVVKLDIDDGGIEWQPFG